MKSENPNYREKSLWKALLKYWAGLNILPPPRSYDLTIKLTPGFVGLIMGCIEVKFSKT
jgi:hypothetical protein